MKEHTGTHPITETTCDDPLPIGHHGQVSAELQLEITRTDRMNSDTHEAALVVAQTLNFAWQTARELFGDRATPQICLEIFDQIDSEVRDRRQAKDQYYQGGIRHRRRRVHNPHEAELSETIKERDDLRKAIRLALNFMDDNFPASAMETLKDIQSQYPGISNAGGFVSPLLDPGLVVEWRQCPRCRAVECRDKKVILKPMVTRTDFYRVMVCEVGTDECPLPSHFFKERFVACANCGMVLREADV